MEFAIAHNTINALDLDKSLDFYKKTLDLKESRRWDNPDVTLDHLGDGR
ncbi:MAG: VOC family protein [Desulfobacteraceae bacterium]|jgi:catechol 2,3-dioxygenase-like lactoylglutathione lyase family enzyme|nr:VOC family protein [Desulfobacteraceae bacterium]